MWYEDVVETIPGWISKMYNKDNPSYRLSAQSFYVHSIDATSLALDLHQMLNITIPNLTDLIAYFDKRQLKDSGFYYEDYVDILDTSYERSLEIAGTYLGFQVSGVYLHYKKCPKYKYNFYRDFLVEGKITQYMSNNMPWDRAPTGAGGMVDHAATMMRCNIACGDAAYKNVIDEMYTWLEKNQNPKTGLWGSQSAQGNAGLVLSAYHLMRGMYFWDDISPKWPERIIDTVLLSLEECSLFNKGGGEGCHDMDHFVTLERMYQYTDHNYRSDDIKQVCEVRLNQLQSLVMSDGGFAFTPHGTIRNHYGYEVTKGIAESDLVGTVFYLETIYRILTVLGEKPSWNSSITHGVISRNG